MLSAKSNTPSALELVRLALIMVSGHRASVPSSLKTHFNTVVREAKLLRDQPGSITEPPDAESIELAFLMATASQLSSEINVISDFDNVSPEMANKLLAGIDRESVCIDQFVPSAR